MNNIGTDENKYKIVNEFVDVNSVNNENMNGNNTNNGDSIWKMICQFGILAIICILSFLVAKYIVRSDIEGEKSPIDTSERL